jgi:hypothetical protein
LSQGIDRRKRRSELMGQESDAVQWVRRVPRRGAAVRTARGPGRWARRMSGGCGHGRDTCITL